MSIEDRLAHAKLEFRKFRIPHPHVARIAAELGVLRKVGQASRREWEAKGMRGARIPQKFLAIIGPSQTGKSTSVQNYLETVVHAEGHDDQVEPVLHVTLSAKATTKSLGSDILEAYLDNDFDVGTARSRCCVAPRSRSRARAPMSSSSTRSTTSSTTTRPVRPPGP